VPSELAAPFHAFSLDFGVCVFDAAGEVHYLHSTVDHKMADEIKTVMPSTTFHYGLLQS